MPFGRGNKPEVAVVLAEREGDSTHLKQIAEIMDHRPILSKKSIALGLAMRDRFLTSYVQSFQPLLPKYVLGETIEVIIKEKDTPRTRELMGDRNKIPSKELDAHGEFLLSEADKNGEISFSFESSEGVKARKIQRFQAVSGKDTDLTDKQKIVFDLLLEKGPLTKAEIRELTAFSDAPLNGLMKKEAVEESFEENLK